MELFCGELLWSGLVVDSFVGLVKILFGVFVASLHWILVSFCWVPLIR